MSGRPKRPVDTPREWLLYADENLQVAQREMKEKMPAYHTICFLCQSAAEKFLKGYLIAGRYPGDISFEQVGEIETREALNAAQNIRNLVHKFMGDMIA